MSFRSRAVLPAVLTIASALLAGCATGSTPLAGPSLPTSSSSAFSFSALATPTTSSATPTPTPTTPTPTKTVTMADPKPKPTTAKVAPSRTTRPRTIRPRTTTSKAAPKAAPKAPTPTAKTIEHPKLTKLYSTGNARQIITVTAPSHSSTTATLSAWTEYGDGWVRASAPITAHLGQNGIGKTKEGAKITPQGGFTLTQAFGRKADPGTALSYFKTVPNDWWDENPESPTYNQHVQQSQSPGGASENLYRTTPYYNYAVLIDYNTKNAPGGVQKYAGSAFFLHVTDGTSTAGCVSISQSNLVSLMRWLKPSANPRILIGVA